MKKLFLLIAICMAFVSCTGNADKTVTSSDSATMDTVRVDSVVVDTVAPDTVQ